MRPIQTLRRFFANIDKLVAAAGRLQEAADNQSASINERLDRLQQGLDNQSTDLNERLDGLQQTAENQSADSNKRLDRLLQSAETLLADINNRRDPQSRTLDQILAATHAISRQLDQLINAVQGGPGNTTATTLIPPPDVKKSAIRGKSDSAGRRDQDDGDHIPYPRIDLAVFENPVPQLIAAPEFAETAAYFTKHDTGSQALLSDGARALLYAIIRNQRPEHVVEIGTFKGGTAKGICRALRDNGKGLLYTVGPYDSEHFLPLLDAWPVELRKRVIFYPSDSMNFYMDMEKRHIRPDIVLVDGNHDYEYALFDIQCAAKHLARSGFILIDNVSQAGPYYAAVDFLAANPEWINCAARPPAVDLRLAFDRDRYLVPDTDFIVLRAPAEYCVGQRPKTFGEITLPKGAVTAITLKLAAPAKGILHTQCVLRGFGAEQVEQVSSASATLEGAGGEVQIELAPALKIEGEFDAYRAEPWLTWEGESTLKLAELPRVL